MLFANGFYLIHHPSDGPPSPEGKVGERENKLTNKPKFISPNQRKNRLMTNLLIKLFIKSPRDVASPAVRRAYGTLASTVGIILNLLLAAGKFTVGFLFGAISVQADAVNNLSDAGSQIISLVTFKMAAKPADRDHPFGQGVRGRAGVRLPRASRGHDQLRRHQRLRLRRPRPRRPGRDLG